MNGDVTIDPSPNVIVQILQPIAEVTIVKENRNLDVVTYGIQGPRGNAFLSGEGIPSSTLGINLDLYLDLTSGYIYRKESGIWIFRVSSIPKAKVYTITQEQIDSKRIILDMAPSIPEAVTFRFVNGTTQDYGEEYTIEGSILTWDGFSLDGFIEVGDIVSISY